MVESGGEDEARLEGKGFWKPKRAEEVCTTRYIFVIKPWRCCVEAACDFGRWLAHGITSECLDGALFFFLNFWFGGYASELDMAPVCG